MDTDNLADNGDCSDFPATGDHRSSLIFLGTSYSSAVPNAMCLIQPSNPPCKVCFQALSVLPERNPNYRLSTLDWAEDVQSEGACPEDAL
ncbi:hypothetical protein L1049_009744 [Liquidambar formosana]|uniref:Uncharacterized protein n=1 Tax=Liquidambar formosana TaxID=63359 RepID=A0AAP0N8Z1_LIQFO